MNDAEADTVRHIMHRYLALGSVRELVDELAREGRTTKVQHRTSGPHRGGILFGRGALFHLLQNRIYRGEIVHKGTAYPGEHNPIVDDALWASVQTKLVDRGALRSSRSNARHPSLLAGMLFDGHGRAMSPSHAVKGTRRYRYYITHASTVDGAEPAWRIAAHDIEKIVIGHIVQLLRDRHKLHSLVSDGDNMVGRLTKTIEAAAELAAAIESGTSSSRIDILQRLQVRVSLLSDRVEVEIPTTYLARVLGCEPALLTDGDKVVLSAGATPIRKGHEVRLIIPGETKQPAGSVPRDLKLIALLGEAADAKRLILAEPTRSINVLAAEHGRCRSRLSKLFALAHLAPDIVGAIVDGRQPRALTAGALMSIDLPTTWHDQRILLGVA